MTSAIDPLVPATNAPLQSAPIRDNFAAAAAEISQLQMTPMAGFGPVTLDLDVIGDTPFTLPVAWLQGQIYFYDASTTISSAVVAAYTGPGGTGTMLMGSPTALAGLTATTAKANILAAGVAKIPAGVVYLRVTAPNGSAATCKCVGLVFTLPA